MQPSWRASSSPRAKWSTVSGSMVPSISITRTPDSLPRTNVVVCQANARATATAAQTRITRRGTVLRTEVIADVRVKGLSGRALASRSETKTRGARPSVSTRSSRRPSRLSREQAPGKSFLSRLACYWSRAPARQNDEGAEGGTRTRTARRPLAPQASASTKFRHLGLRSL